MFSCVLVQASEKAEDSSCGDYELVAEAVSLNVQAVSNAGRGVAECRYALEEKVDDLLACVPSTVVHGASTQLVKVTQCCLKEQHPDAGTIPQTACLRLTKLDSNYSEQASSLPSYPTIKKLLRRCVSPDDLILHLGHFEAGTILTLKFEFLLQLKLSFQESQSSNFCRQIIQNSIPSKHVSYELRYASHVPVVDVSSSISSHPLTNFSWAYADRTKQVIKVSFTTEQPEGKPKEKCFGFYIETPRNDVQSTCCSCLVQTNSKQSGVAERKYDGLMLLSAKLSRDQVLAGRSSEHLHPSEIVFLVDCSASMNQAFIDSVIATLLISIKSLPRGCFFNVISFGSTYRQLFPESKEYSNATVKSAVDFANQLKASLGGTELLPPLKWIFKTARKSDLPCQIFIITDVDQEVKDVPHMLSTIKKNRHHARCHTFGIGSNICKSLVTSIAEVSGGRSVILTNEDRLQTKVMEVLRESLDPFLMDTRIRWQPPEGYTVVDSTPKSLGTVFSNQTHLAFAFLKKAFWTSSRGSVGSAVPAATIVGTLDGVEVEVPIQKTSLPPLSPTQTTKLGSILEHVGVWSKLEELEVGRLTAVSRKNSTEEEEEEGTEPTAKRPRLNGEIATSILLPASEIQRDLVELSLESGIPCPFTFLLGTTAGGRGVLQALPYKRPSHKNGKNGVISHVSRKHPRRKNHHHHTPLSEPQHNSSTVSLAKSTISAISSSFMNFFNMLSPDPLLVEGGKTIDDELEIQRTRKTQLFWDEARGEIKYPSTYYQNSTASSNSKSLPTAAASNQQARNSHHASGTWNGRCTRAEEKMETTPAASQLLPSQRYILDTSSSSDDEEDVTISDSDSDSSVELDWASLPKTREYLPLIQMQLFSGAWPMAHEFSYAVRVPLSEIEKLPLLCQESRTQPKTNSHSMAGNCFPVQRTASQEPDDEAKAHFWTTALAVVCFRECFPQLEEEWTLIVRKGEEWLQENLHQCTLTWPAIQSAARELLFHKA